MVKPKVLSKLSILQKRLALIASIIVAVSLLYPIVVSSVMYVVGVIRFANERERYDQQISMLINYIEVDKGLSKAQMEPADTLYTRYVNVIVNGEEVERKVDIRIQHSGDFKIFVDDGNVGMYGTYFNYSIDEWEYYDFEKNHVVTFRKE